VREKLLHPERDQASGAIPKHALRNCLALRDETGEIGQSEDCAALSKTTSSR
jgi:hypothetical protein